MGNIPSGVSLSRYIKMKKENVLRPSPDEKGEKKALSFDSVG